MLWPSQNASVFGLNLTQEPPVCRVCHGRWDTTVQGALFLKYWELSNSKTVREDNQFLFLPTKDFFKK